MQTTYIASAFLISIFIVSCYTSDVSLEQDSPKGLIELSPRHLPMIERHARAVNRSAAEQSSSHVPIVPWPHNDSGVYTPLENDTNLYEPSRNSTDSPDLASGLDPGTTSTSAYREVDNVSKILQAQAQASTEAPRKVPGGAPGGVPSVPSASSATPLEALDDIIKILRTSTKAPRKVPGEAPGGVPSVLSATFTGSHQNFSDSIKLLQVHGSAEAYRVAPGGVLLGASGRASPKAPGGAPTKAPGGASTNKVPSGAPEEKISDKDKFSKKNKFGKKNKYWKRLVFRKKKMST